MIQHPDAIAIDRKQTPRIYTRWGSFLEQSYFQKEILLHHRNHLCLRLKIV